MEKDIDFYTKMKEIVNERIQEIAREDAKLEERIAGIGNINVAKILRSQKQSLVDARMVSENIIKYLKNAQL